MFPAFKWSMGGTLEWLILKIVLVNYLFNFGSLTFTFTRRTREYRAWHWSYFKSTSGTPTHPSIFRLIFHYLHLKAKTHWGVLLTPKKLLDFLFKPKNYCYRSYFSKGKFERNTKINYIWKIIQLWSLSILYSLML